MHVPGRDSPRHMKGKQVALTLYLPPRKYWLLKALSQKCNVPMQSLLRRALDEVLRDAYKNAPDPYRTGSACAPLIGE